MTPKQLKHIHREISEGAVIESPDAAWMWNTLRSLAFIAERTGMNAEAMKELGPIELNGETED